MKDIPHEPVLLREILSYLPEKRLHTMVDCTLGAGGHASAILSARAHDIRTYIGLDKDRSALDMAQERLAAFATQTKFVHGDFRDVCTLVQDAVSDDVAQDVHGVLMDIGVSSMQLDQGERGFSFARDGPLDMRMDRRAVTSAADLVNNLSEDELADLIYQFGEERASRKIASAIVAARASAPLTRTGQLADLVRRVGGGWRRKGMHPATRTFQALRIAVNGELDALDAGVQQAVRLLAPGGRLCVISFHSLEDRLVKRRFRELQHVPGGVRVITKKAIMADAEECARNVRARSAKLRVVERVGRDVVGHIGKINKYANLAPRARREGADGDGVLGF